MMIGFLDDERRFNAALTRARRKAVVVSNAATVTAGEVFDDFVDYACERGDLVELPVEWGLLSCATKPFGDNCPLDEKRDFGKTRTHTEDRH